MDVAAVASEDRLVPQEAAQDGEADLEKRKRQRQRRRGDSQHGGRFLTPDDGIGTKQEADEQAARATEKYRGLVEVVPQEPEQAAREGSGCQPEGEVAM